MTAHLICYIESIPTADLEVELEWQLEQSLDSLRSQSPNIPVELLWFGNTIPDPVQTLLDRHRVTITPLGDLKSYLEARFPGTALDQIPDRAKWIALAELKDRDVDQILCLSRRTVIVEPLETLFERHQDHSIYAREAPFSSHDRRRHQQGYINQPLLEKLAHPHDSIPVFNLDILLLNHQIWKVWAARAIDYLSLLWRFTLWLTFKVRDYSQDVIHIRTHQQIYLQTMAVDAAVPFPSLDPNLRDSIAMSLVLGSLPDLSYGLFDPDEVFQDSEFLDLTLEDSSVLLGSYGPFADRFGDWILNGATPLTQPLTPAGIAFRAHRYALMPTLIEQPLISVAFTYCLHQLRNGRLSQKDPLVPHAPHAYADPFTESLLEILRPQVEAATGLSLYPTYSFFRVYRRGDELRRHSDRPSSEFNVSLMIGSDGDSQQTPWPLHLEAPTGTVAVELNPGDGVVYRGGDLMHWRHPFEGNLQIQIILAYVDSMGPFREWKYDRRSRLGSQT